MSKRRNLNGQMSKEEYEAKEDGDAEEAGTWKAADPSVLKQRKRIKVRSRGSKKTPAAKAAVGGGGGGGSTGGIFGSVSLTSTGPNSSSKPAAAKTTTPMFNFGAAKPATAAPSSSSLFSFEKKSSSTGGGGFTFNKPPAMLSSPSSVTAPSGGNGDRKKVAELNVAFASWVKSQHSKHPSLSWAVGMHDYLKHAGGIVGRAAKKQPAPSATILDPSKPALFSLSTAGSAPSLFPPKTDRPKKGTGAPGSLFGAPKPIVSTPAPAKAAEAATAGKKKDAAPPSSGGVDGEDEVLKQRVKILRFRKGDDEQPWGTMGIHNVSIMVNGATRKARILARDETPLAKLQINSHLYKGMKVERAGKKGVKINLLDEKEESDGKGGMVKKTVMSMYLIRCKSGEMADKLSQTISDTAKTCS
jgi:hypothetical protein